GPLGDDVDRAARGVPAVEGPLRALEQFHALEVVEHAAERRRRGEVDAVQVHSDRRIGEGIAAEVADRTNGEGRVGDPARLDLDTGRLARQCLDVRDARIAQVVTTD